MKKYGWFLCALIILGIGGFYGVRSFKRLLVRTTAIKVTCNLPVDAQTVNAIAAACNKLFEPLSDTWFLAIKKQFPLIARITSAREGDVVQIHISGVNLYARVNEDRVIDDQGNTYTITGLDPVALAALPHMRVAKQSDQEVELFKKFIKALPVAIYQQYTVDWQSPYRIYLIPNNNGCTCIIRYDQIPTPELIVLGNELALKQTKKTNATIDFRFADQIVVNPHKYVNPG